ncbi:MAG: FGGY family carbohydrate kinase, partial [Micrococcales bacterium]
EHHPEQIWQAALAATRAAMKTSGIAADQVTAIGITNQRETVALWDRVTLEAVTPAIVWQDRRTSQLLSDPKFEDATEWVRQATGLPLDPYFSSSKLLWIKRNLPDAWAGVESGQVAIGTIDSYLAARITDGAHITDATNASRTQLFNLHTLDWDERLLELFEVPRAALPSVVANQGHLAQSDPAAFLGINAPITGMAGDQHAALFGQLAFQPGDAKCTYGTGAFLLCNTGDSPVLTDPKLIATLAWVNPDGSPTYAIEGSVFVAGAALQWLRDGLQMVEQAADVERLAQTVETSDGVCVVPAFTGLGAPFWDADARGSILGLTRGTTKAHIARATLESLAFQVTALVGAMAAATEGAITSLKVDGGVTRSGLLMQLQADTLGIPVEVPENLETTGLGVAYLAGLGAGIWKSREELQQTIAARFYPAKNLEHEYQRWLRAVEATRAF